MKQQRTFTTGGNQYQVAIDEYDKVPLMVDEFMQMIFEKGPNPFKGY